MAAKALLADFGGMVTAPGVSMRAPTTMSEAINCVIEAPGVLRKRRGFQKLNDGATLYPVGGPIWAVFSDPALGSKFLVHAGTASGATFVQSGTGKAAWTSMDTPDASTVTRAYTATRTSLTRGSTGFYMTAEEGVFRFDSGLAALSWAGMPRGDAPDTYNMDSSVYTVLNTSGGFLVDGSNCAYRVTWHLKDASGTELGGPPTGRLVVRNETGSSGWVTTEDKDVTLRLPLPWQLGTIATDITTSYYYRLWRSRQASSGLADDELFLVSEGFVSAANITAGYVTVTDSTPDGFLVSAPKLNTNQTDFGGDVGLAQGIVNADEPPPQCDVVAYWRDVLWCGNTTNVCKLQFSLLLVGGAGFVATDTILINSTEYTGVAGAPASATEFTAVSGLATLEKNVEATARNLCEAVNRNQADGARLYYVSQPGNLPGTILAVAAKVTGAYASLSVQSDRGGAFSPNITTATNGTQDGGINWLTYSKQYRPDAMPLVNQFQVGPTIGGAIRAITPFRDRLVVWTDSGVYQVVGNTYADFQVLPFDLSFRLMCPSTPVVCDDKMYAWCREGIVELDDGGLKVISTPIEPTVQSIVKTATRASMEYLAFAIADKENHRVLFYYPEGPDSSTLRGCGFWLVWDTRMRSWTRGYFEKDGSYRRPMGAGCTRGDDGRVCLASWNSAASDAWVFEQRLAYAASDYSDATFADGTDAVELSVTFNALGGEDAEGAAHWRQVVLCLESGSAGANPSWASAPSTLSLDATNENGTTATETVTPVSGQQVLRFEMPRAVRRSNRIRFTLRNAVAEYVGISQVGFNIGPASQLHRRANS